MNGHYIYKELHSVSFELDMAITGIMRKSASLLRADLCYSPVTNADDRLSLSDHLKE